jgi:NADP-dependent 3-hydroxy acid dehydrogenase YdfG
MDKPLIAITGASSGIGAAMAKLFAQQGYPLLLMARRIAQMKALKLERVECHSVDVTDRKAVVAAVQSAEEKWGPMDAIINCAGVMLLGRMREQDPSEWENMIDINIKGVLNGVSSAIKGMVERRRGTIINIGSVAGRKTFPNHVVYVGTKFAVHAISENLREELSPYNVRVITIAPGAVDTHLLEHTTDEAVKASYQA